MIIDLGKYYLYRHIRLDKNVPYLGKKRTGTWIKKAIINNKLAYGYNWKEVIS